MKMNLKLFFITLIACSAVTFFSCKEKAETYQNRKVFLNDNDLEMIELPRVIDAEGTIDTTQVMNYPLPIYQAEENLLKELAGVYNKFKGIDDTQARKIKNLFADLREGEYTYLLSDEKDLEKCEAYYKELKGKQWESDEREIAFATYGNLQESLYQGVKGIVALLDDVDEFNEGGDQSWFESIEELFEFNSEEAAVTLAKITNIFPEITFISSLSEIEE